MVDEFRQRFAQWFILILLCSLSWYAGRNLGLSLGYSQGYESGHNDTVESIKGLSDPIPFYFNPNKNDTLCIENENLLLRTVSPTSNLTYYADCNAFYSQYSSVGLQIQKEHLNTS